jgi:hypothetical protein
MAEPKTFEEFEDYMQKKSYLYPATSFILSRENYQYERGELTQHYFSRRAKIKRLWKEYKSAPSVECILAFTHYFNETYDALERFCASNQEMIKKPIDPKRYYYLKDLNKVEYTRHVVLEELLYFNGKEAADKFLDKLKECSGQDDDTLIENMISISKNMVMDSNERSVYAFTNHLNEKTNMYPIKETQQPYYDVTDFFEKSINPDKGCNLFSNTVKQNKKIYAFKGPAIHKWKKDEKMDLMRDDNGHGVFMMNLNDELIFWSVLCAPFSTPDFDEYVTPYYEDHDLRFIADTEILDVAEYYSKKHPKEYRRMQKGKDSCYYGIYLDEIEKIRELIKPADGEAVYFITGWSIDKTLEPFYKFHNNSKLASKNKEPVLF